MNRSLAVYLFVLDFFMLLIAVLCLFVLARADAHYGNGVWFSFWCTLLSPLASLIYVGYTYRSERPEVTESDEGIIDSPDLYAADQESPIPGYIQLVGILCLVMGIGVFLFATYNLYNLWKEDKLNPLLRSNTSVSVILTVYLFNALGQSIYVIRTFYNVKRIS